MEEISKFLVQYWQLILAAILSVVSVVISLIRKKPVNITNLWDEVLAQIVSGVPSLVATAELLPDTDKKKWVLSQSLGMAANSLGRTLNEAEIKLLTAKVDNAIETVLYCPTKKGGIGRES